MPWTSVMVALAEKSNHVEIRPNRIENPHNQIVLNGRSTDAATHFPIMQRREKRTTATTTTT